MIRKVLVAFIVFVVLFIVDQAIKYGFVYKGFGFEMGLICRLSIGI